MKRDWREYNNQLVKKGEMLISPQAFSGVKVPNFRTLHYRFSKMDISLESFPDPRVIR